MARAARMALDAALLSIEKVRPVIASVWGSTKSIVTKTPAKPLVRNQVIEKVEDFLENMTDTLVSKMAWMRDKQLPGELRYLEKELEKTRRRMGSQGNNLHRSVASKTLKPELSIAWQYCKIECAPPMTVAFFAGSGGAKIEQIVGGAVNSFIGNLESTIRKIDEDEARAKKDKEDKIRKEQERLKAEELKKRQEAAKKAEEAKKAQEKEAAAKQKEAKKPELKPAEKKPSPTQKQPQPEAKKQSAPPAAAKKEPPKTPPKAPSKKEDPKKKK